MRAISPEEFVVRAKKVHGDKYDYTRSAYVGATAKVEILCPIHGYFWQIADGHLHGAGCPDCGWIQRAKSRALSTDEFLERAKLVHKDHYVYENVSCLGGASKITIKCLVHGEFVQSARLHLLGHGCPKCGLVSRSVSHVEDREHFIAKAQQVHGIGRYDYSKVVYKKARETVEVICPRHGSFEQEADCHLAGHGCPKCYDERRGDTTRHTEVSFLERSRAVHGTAYTYDLTGYRNQNSYITVFCRLHGSFKQKAKLHLAGQGCPGCSVQDSAGETELFQWIKSLCPDAVSRCHSILSCNRELDIVVPSAKIAIEFNGTYWHSCPPGNQKQAFRDFKKWTDCQAQGYALFVVWEHDW